MCPNAIWGIHDLVPLWYHLEDTAMDCACWSQPKLCLDLLPDAPATVCRAFPRFSSHHSACRDNVCCGGILGCFPGGSGGCSTIIPTPHFHHSGHAIWFVGSCFGGHRDLYLNLEQIGQRVTRPSSAAISSMIAQKSFRQLLLHVLRCQSGC